MDARKRIIELAQSLNYRTDGNRVTDLDFYKKEVNLVALAETLGYRVNPEKTGRNQAYSYHFVTMDKGDPKAPDDRILVSKNAQGQFKYKSVIGADGFAAGSAIDLIQRSGKDFRGAIAHLDAFITQNGLGASPLNLSAAPVTRDDLERELNSFSNIRKLGRTGEAMEFLKSRGFEEREVFSDKFRNRIAVSLKTETATENGKEVTRVLHENVAFPMSGPNGISHALMGADGDTAQGFDVRNTAWKSGEHYKAGALWHSNFDPAKPIDTVYFTESPIDAMSHYVLNQEQLQGKNVLYTATGGSVGDAQILLLHKPFDGIKFKPDPDRDTVILLKAKELKTLFDNDLQGGYHTCKTLAQVSVDTFSDSQGGLLKDAKVIPMTFPKQNSATVMMIAENMPAGEGAKWAQELGKQLQNLSGNSPYKSSQNERFRVQVPDISEGKAVVQVSFFNQQKNWQIFNKYLTEQRFGKGAKVAQEQPILKDWNDDLKAVRGLDKDLKEKYENHKAEEQQGKQNGKNKGLKV